MTHGKTTTKEQERNALDKIKEILATLEADSYVNTAFKGCVEIAESNIDNDFACSMKDVLDSAQKKLSEQEKTIELITNQKIALHAENIALTQQFEKFLDWKHVEERGGISCSNYTELKDSCVGVMSESAAKELLRVHGFDTQQVKILHSATAYQKNRLGQLRECGTVERNPYYYASDYNYILFECGGYTHALVNGTIFFNI